MRAKVEAIGLTHLVAVSPQDAVGRVTRAIEAGAEDPKDFDPLMAMSNNFLMRVAEKIGPAMIFSAGPDGKPWCPLCLVRRDFEAHNTPTGKCGKPACTITIKQGDQPWDEVWIESCGNAQLEFAKQQGLVKIN